MHRRLFAPKSMRLQHVFTTAGGDVPGRKVRLNRFSTNIGLLSIGPKLLSQTAGQVSEYRCI